MAMRLPFLMSVLVGLWTGGISAQSASNPASDQDANRALAAEEETDYFRKWLREDVVYIITPEEKQVFLALTTPEEKEQFIEQFWRRRDPDPRTAENEFKEEHYRRIAYANENFASGEPGWMTDRGRIYIIHGPPTQIESHPAGGPYDRPSHEGGGSTSTFPFEIWWYRYMEGVGSDIELEFVDRNGGNQYRLVMDPNYKDVLLWVNNAGQTLAEELGIAQKRDRPFFSPENKNRYPFMNLRAKDDPFIKYETLVAARRPKEIKYKDLQEIVKVNIEYTNLPFQLRQDFFRLNRREMLVPVTVQFDNRHLKFDQEEQGYVARLGIYGMVTSLQNRVVEEFEDEVTTRFRADELQRGLQGRSLYQRILTLDRSLRYKLDLVVKDLRSGQIGAIRQAIIPPALADSDLTLSSLVLAEFIELLDDPGVKDDRMFVLGDVWLRPSLSHEFPANQSLGVYVQAYNFGIDQASLTPQLETHYRIFREGRKVLEVTDLDGSSVRTYSADRLVLVRQLPVNLLEVEVRDGIKNQRVVASSEFSLVGGS